MATAISIEGDHTGTLLEFSTELGHMPDKAVLDLWVEILVHCLDVGGWFEGTCPDYREWSFY